MPCGGGDIGLNVWVENGDLLFYVAKSGTFDNNNTVLKLGRIRVRLSPNPFVEGATFRQELVLNKGHVEIRGATSGLSANVTVWVDVFRPAVHIDVTSNKAIKAEASFESWRYVDHVTKGKENNANSYKFAPPGEIKTLRDSIRFVDNEVVFYHRNGPERSAFAATVHQQGLDSVKSQLFNPLTNLTFGGSLSGKGMTPSGNYRGTYLHTDFQGWRLVSAKPARSHSILLALHTEQTAGIDDWKHRLATVKNEIDRSIKTAQAKTQSWWQDYWAKSFIYVNTAPSSPEWQMARNYQLFRYMLGCNAFGKYPTKFNGGLFTYDPSLTDSSMTFTPDFRNWGGGIHTAQNQRLVYWPMLKSGDWMLMKPQFDFYQNILKNAELRTAVYWQHKGASFTEQIENFGLPNFAEYGTKRPAGYDQGMEYNAWLEYEWDTVLEFCLMMLETERYAGQRFAGQAMSAYVPFVESCLTFFDEHYQYLAKKRGSKALDADKKLILYPGSGAETYKMAYNSTSTISALRTVLTRLLELPDTYLSAEKRAGWKAMLDRIPAISFRSCDGHPTIAPAKLWERINNVESPQLYPVFPWSIYGIGKPGLDTAINTYRYDKDVLKFRSHVGWKQDNIFAARLGLTDEAARLANLKLGNSGRRFPAFWGPGYDWTPDHNWGGSGMIGLQEMLLQADGRKIYLFPAWPKAWDVHVKLHAPYETIVEAVLKNGKLESLTVTPESRRADVVNLLN